MAPNLPAGVGREGEREQSAVFKRGEEQSIAPDDRGGIARGEVHRPGDIGTGAKVDGWRGPRRRNPRSTGTAELRPIGGIVRRGAGD